MKKKMIGTRSWIRHRNTKFAYSVTYFASPSPFCKAMPALIFFSILVDVLRNVYPNSEDNFNSKNDSIHKILLFLKNNIEERVGNTTE